MLPPATSLLFTQTRLIRCELLVIFDDIQNIQRKETKTIPFKELGWPEGTRFIYSPFMVLAYVDNEKIADIHFAENGNLHFVIFTKKIKKLDAITLTIEDFYLAFNIQKMVFLVIKIT